MHLDDSTLTKDGLRATGAGRILLLACGALAREILALKAANGWDHMELAVPACQSAFVARPYSRRGGTRRSGKPRTLRADFLSFTPIAARAGCCRRAAMRWVSRWSQAPHCYAFFEGVDRFAAHAEDEITAFYLTDFLVRQFDAFVWQPMGFDRHPELIQMMFGNYTKADLSGPDRRSGAGRQGPAIAPPVWG